MKHTNKIISINLRLFSDGKIKAEMVATGIPFGSERYNLEFDNIREFAAFIVKDWEYAQEEDQHQEQKRSPKTYGKSPLEEAYNEILGGCTCMGDRSLHCGKCGPASEVVRE